MSKALLALAAALALDCSGSPKKPASPACSDEQLAKIEAAYIAEATEACSGKTFDNCEALPGIRAK